MHTCKLKVVKNLVLCCVIIPQCTHVYTELRQMNSRSDIILWSIDRQTERRTVRGMDRQMDGWTACLAATTLCSFLCGVPKWSLSSSASIHNMQQVTCIYTVEPLNNGHIRPDHFVHREVVLFRQAGPITPLCACTPWSPLCDCTPWSPLCACTPWSPLCDCTPWSPLCACTPWRYQIVQDINAALIDSYVSTQGCVDKITMGIGDIMWEWSTYKQCVLFPSHVVEINEASDSLLFVS